VTRIRAVALRPGDTVHMTVQGTRWTGVVTDTSHVRAGYVFVAWGDYPPRKDPISWISDSAD
jgi:hypothetical protein